MSAEPAEISELKQDEDVHAASEGDEDNELQNWWHSLDEDEQYIEDMQ